MFHRPSFPALCPQGGRATVANTLFSSGALGGCCGRLFTVVQGPLVEPVTCPELVTTGETESHVAQVPLSLAEVRLTSGKHKGSGEREESKMGLRCQPSGLSLGGCAGRGCAGDGVGLCILLGNLWAQFQLISLSCEKHPGGQQGALRIYLTIREKAPPWHSTSGMAPTGCRTALLSRHHQLSCKGSCSDLGQTISRSR